MCTVYTCRCNTHVGLEESIICKSYQVGPGNWSENKRGYLFSSIVNVVLGPRTQEKFTTGKYDISKVSCVICRLQLGWKYLSADRKENENKVGTFCLKRIL